MRRPRATRPTSSTAARREDLERRRHRRRIGVVALVDQRDRAVEAAGPISTLQRSPRPSGGRQRPARPRPRRRRRPAPRPRPARASAFIASARRAATAGTGNAGCAPWPRHRFRPAPIAHLAQRGIPAGRCAEAHAPRSGAPRRSEQRSDSSACRGSGSRRRPVRRPPKTAAFARRSPPDVEELSPDAPPRPW